MLEHDRSAETKFHKEQEHGDNCSKAACQQSDSSKELQWPGRVVKQELDVDEIQQNPERPGKAVIGFAILARDSS